MWFIYRQGGVFLLPVRNAALLEAERPCWRRDLLEKLEKPGIIG
jgi:hypothetical protein